MGTVGGMKGKENHMHMHSERMGREGHKEGKMGVGSYHTHPSNHGTAVANNNSGAHVHKKPAGFNQGVHTGGEGKAHAVTNMHSGKAPNNK